MPALDNTITAADLAFAQDVQFANAFDQDMSRLVELLGIGSVETLAAGTALYQYKVTGTLGDGQAGEGDEVPLSKYTEKRTPIGELTAKAYRKLTTAQAIQKHGYEHAVEKTDQKMIQDVRGGIVSDFFKLLDKGTGSATGKTFKASMIQANAALADALEKAGDPAEGFVFFANYLDYANWAADHDVHNDGAGSVFGLNYIANLAGIVGTVVFSAHVAKGAVYATPSANIHAYVPDFSALAQGGLAYATGDLGTIGVAHEAAYNRVSCVTNVLAGVNLVPEVTNYIVKATIAPGA